MKVVLAGIANTTLTKGMLVAIQFGVMTLLARELSEGDYGVVGFATVIISLLQRINSLSLPTALIQAKHLDQTVLDTGASLNLVVSVLAFLVAQACAPLAGILLESPEAVGVVRLLALQFLLAPAGFLQLAVLTREMKFGSLRRAFVTGNLVRGAVQVTLALTGWRYWSIAIGALAGFFVGQMILMIGTPMRWRFRIDRPTARQLLHVGVPLTLAGLVTFGLLNADNFVIGSMLGKDLLGQYTIAFIWATFSCTLLAEMVQSVLMPHFARLQGSPSAMRSTLLRALGPVACVAGLMAAGLFVLTDVLLIDVLGDGTDKWAPAADILRLLCAYSVVRAITETLANPILALGDSKTLLRANLYAAVAEILLLPLAVSWLGLMGAAIVVSVAYLTQWALYLPYLRARLEVTPRDLATTLLPVLVATAGSAACGWLVPLDGEHRLVMAVVRGCVVVATFLVIHEVASRGRLLRFAGDAWRSVRSRR